MADRQAVFLCGQRSKASWLRDPSLGLGVPLRAEVESGGHEDRICVSPGPV